MPEFMPQLNWINQIQIPDYEKELKPGWDGYGGRVPTAEAMRTARLMSLVPGGDGSLQFEIHAGGYDVEIYIAPHGEITDVSAERRANPQPSNG